MNNRYIPEVIEEEKSFEDLVKALQHIPTDFKAFIIDPALKGVIDLSPLEDIGHCYYLSQNGGEHTKSVEEAERAVGFFLEKKIHRNAVVVAIGGGATLDFAGFMASVMLRGIRWVSVPTTILAMVDSAIGGKTAINIGNYKNMVGTFHPAEKVFLYFPFLDSLPAQEVESGKGEILKYALLNKDIHDMVVGGADLKHLIRAAISYKQEIVKADFMDLGVRKFLNLGHTFAHAFERLLSLPHGLSVVLGIELVVSKILQDKTLLRKVEELKERLKIEIIYDEYLLKENWDEIVTSLRLDKKRKTCDLITMVLLDDVGKPVLKDVSLCELCQII